jgi:hypothetical protein
VALSEWEAAYGNRYISVAYSVPPQDSDMPV